MNKLDVVCQCLREMGLEPVVEDSVVNVKFEMKNISIFVSNGCGEDEESVDNYINVSYHGFYVVEDEEVADVLVVCNKANRELRQIKTYLSDDLTYVSSAFEFWYLKNEDLCNSLKYAFFMISHVRSWFAKELRDVKSASEPECELLENKEDGTNDQEEK